MNKKVENYFVRGKIKMADNVATMHRQKVSITTNNMPSNGSYSASAFPQINFVISQRAAFLDPRTLRLCGKVRLRESGTENLPNNAPSNPAGSPTTNGVLCGGNRRLLEH